MGWDCCLHGCFNRIMNRCSHDYDVLKSKPLKIEQNGETVFKQVTIQKEGTNINVDMNVKRFFFPLKILFCVCCCSWHVRYRVRILSGEVTYVGHGDTLTKALNSAKNKMPPLPNVA